jgi:putative DNA primase/helicase
MVDQCQAKMTEADIRATCEARAQAEAAEQLAAKKAGGNGSGGGVDYRFLKRCLDCNELGDGLLFAALHREKFVFNASGQQWMRYTGHHWETDVEDRSQASVEDAASGYLSMLPVIAGKLERYASDRERCKRLGLIQTKVLKRVNRLRSIRGRLACLKLAASNQQASLVTTADAFDLSPWLLPCKNAVIDLRLGDTAASHPADMLLKAAPTEWRGVNQPCPTWERTLIEIFERDEDLIGYLHRLLGYCITGHIFEHTLPIWTGKGRNGKGTIAETMMYVVGELAKPIQAEMLLDQGRSRSSAAPSPDIMALKGLRCAFASESDENRKFSMSRVKWLTGGDQLTGRWPNDKFPTCFVPTHKLILLTNDLPHAPAGDFAFWERVHVVPFGLQFVNREPSADTERRSDLGLRQKLEQEASGILAWLVRGCLEWQRIGLYPPEKVRAAIQRYRQEEDILQDWIDDRCTLDRYAETPASKLYANFADWWVRNVTPNRKKVPSQHVFGRWLTKKYKREKKGTYMYYGIDCDWCEENECQPSVLGPRDAH